MKVKILSLTIIFCFMTIVKCRDLQSAPEPVNILCKFHFTFNKFCTIPDQECEIINKEIFKGYRVKIGGFLGDPYDKEVSTSLRIENANLRLFPTNFQKLFNFLNAIDIRNSNLIEITNEDLKYFPKLTILILPENEIEIIREDLFHYNANLKLIHLWNNKIKHIDPKTFSHLLFLSDLNLEGNNCHLDQATEFENTQKLVKKIEKNHQCQYFENSEGNQQKQIENIQEKIKKIERNVEKFLRNSERLYSRFEEEMLDMYSNKKNFETTNEYHARKPKELYSKEALYFIGILRDIKNDLLAKYLKKEKELEAYKKLFEKWNEKIKKFIKN
ncbi:hypothetical protein PVAND_014980 [Polypedilum vanderplanki]|uniref:Uncharacterized protein n=1 Tax=Polypedilum vanderplanki TaxID=319348 RepID=A0A9J6BAR8_POLVA|nr:hypothetical protein PVAND_014980 [Polypedilum vanderplanki]